jgi:hypothetical protein
MENKQLFYEASPLTYTTIDNNQTAFLASCLSVPTPIESANSLIYLKSIVG